MRSANAAVGAVAFAVACARPPTAAPSPPDPFPAEARVFYLRAESALASGDLEGATTAAQWLVRLDPRNPFAWTRLAEVCLAAGEPTAALEAAEGALSRDDLVPARNAAAGALLALGRPQEALGHLNGMPGTDPALSVAAWIAVGDLAAATAAHQRWEPDGVTARIAHAAAAVGLGDYERGASLASALLDDPFSGPDAAQVVLDAGLQQCDLRPVHAWANAHRDRAWEPAWRPVLGAIASVTRDLSLGVEVARASGDAVALAEAYRVSGEPERALATLPHPATDDARAVVAAALRDADRIDEARAIATDLSDRARVAWLTATGGFSSEILELTDGLVSTDLDLVSARALALVAAGRNDEALALVEALPPSNAATIWVAEVLARRGEADAALAKLTAAAAAPCAVTVWSAWAAALSDSCETADRLRHVSRVWVGDAVIGKRATAAALACTDPGGGGLR